MKKELKLIQMSNVEVEDIKWVWYPYIPYGKITVVQGDPGEGKTTFILALVALLTKGEPLPEEEQANEPINVIYQTAEDGLADTICVVQMCSCEIEGIHTGGGKGPATISLLC